MKIHSLEIENFLVFRHMKKVFGGRDIIGVVCEFKGNPARSNRGGKTAVIDAIRFALQGTSRAEREIDLIHHGAERMLVTLVLDDDGKLITIKRGRDIKNNGVLEISGIEKKKEAQQEINDLIGFDKDEFGLTCFFSQGEIDTFMNLRPAEKSKYLSQWLKNQHWALLARAALDKLNIKQKRVVRLQAKIETLTSQLTGEDEAKAELKKIGENKKTVTASIHSWEATVSRLQEIKKGAADIGKRIDELNKRVSTKSGASSKLEIVKCELEDLEGKLSRLQATNPESEDILITKRADLGVEFGSIQQKIEAAKRGSSGVCPILKKPCERINFDSQKFKIWKKRREEIKVLLSKNELEMNRQRSIRSLKEGTSELQISIARLQEQAKGLTVDRRELERLKEQRIKASDGELESALFHLKAARGTLADLDAQTGTLKERLDRIAKTRRLIQKLEAKQIRMTKTVACLRYCAFMFGKNGIPSQEIENAFDEIEDETNSVLDKFGLGLQIQFRPEKELQTWEDCCVECGWTFPRGTRARECEQCGAARQRKRKDELELRVLDAGKEEGFNMESGGGKTMVSLAVRLALTRLKQRQTGSRFNVLFLDEVDSQLDVANRDAFIRLVTTTLVQKFGVEQVFIISHNKTISESTPHTLKVVRYGTHSKAEWLQ